MAIIDISSQLSYMDQTRHSRFEMNAGYDIRTEAIDDSYFLGHDFDFYAGSARTILKHGFSGAAMFRHMAIGKNKWTLNNAVANWANKGSSVGFPRSPNNPEGSYNFLNLSKYHNLGFQLGFALTGDFANPVNTFMGMGVDLFGRNVERFLKLKDPSLGTSLLDKTMNTTYNSAMLLGFITSLGADGYKVFAKHDAAKKSRTINIRTMDGASFLNSVRTHGRNRLSSEDMANYAALAKSLQENVSFNQNPAKSYLNQIMIRNQ